MRRRTCRWQSATRSRNGPIVFLKPMGDSMKTQFEQMMNGLNDVEAFLAGKQEGFRAHVPQEVDVKAIRNRLGMTHKPDSPIRSGSALTPSSTGREVGESQKHRLAPCSP